MFEHMSEPLLARGLYRLRVLRGVRRGLLILAGALGAGMAGYHFTEQMPWVDAFVNAAMILSGMGPVAPLATVAGKLFAGCYALFSGLAFIGILGFVFAPVVHRFLHAFHATRAPREPGQGGR